jgi:flagellar protein FliL
VSEDTAAESFELDGEGDGGAKSKLSGKKLVMMIGVPVMLIAGGAGAWFSGLLGGGASEPTVAASEQPARAVPPPVKTVFYDLPEMLVNLNTPGRRPSFLKIQVSLELTNEDDAKRLEKLRPRIVDNFQVYLRELRVDDLRGSAGMYRLREELLARVNSAVQPAKVKDVLFKEILVQ